jgi:hypothetical protein
MPRPVERSSSTCAWARISRAFPMIRAISAEETERNSGVKVSGVFWVRIMHLHIMEEGMAPRRDAGRIGELESQGSGS